MKTTPTTRSSRTFEQRVSQVAEFQDANGRLPRRTRTGVPAAEGKLGYVVKDFRTDYRLQTLSPEQIQTVETIHGWSWNAKAPAAADAPAPTRIDVGPLTAKFATTLQILIAWVEANDRIPVSRVDTSAERILAAWCRAQRVRRTTVMTSAEFAALETVHHWFWEHETKGAAWRSRADAYESFIALTGEKPKKSSNDAAERSIARWGTGQRMKRINSMLPPLTAAQITRLEAITGWSWTNRRHAETWHTRFTAFSDFVLAHGRIPKEHGSPLEQRLYRWMHSQRIKYADGALTEFYPERVRLLETVDGWTWRVEVADKWLATFVECFTWVALEGRLPSEKSADTVERRLGTWAGHCRRAMDPGKSTMKLTSERIAALNLITGWYWIGEKN